MKVSHATLGIGTVIAQDAKNVTVEFNGTIKTMVIAFARLINEDGSAFGTTFVAPTKKTISKKKLAEKLRVTSDTPAAWMNADGTKNWDKYNDFLEQRERDARNSHSHTSIN